MLRFDVVSVADGLDEQLFIQLALVSESHLLAGRESGGKIVVRVAAVLVVADGLYSAACCLSPSSSIADLCAILFFVLCVLKIIKFS